MSFEYENGSGSPTANSGVDLVYFDDYLDTRLKVCCTATDDNTKAQIQEANLVESTSYILGRYEGLLIGTRKVETQRLLFPRVDENGIEINDDFYKQAICKLAIKSDSLDSDEELEADSDKMVTKEKVDVIEVQYSQYSKDEVLYNSVDTLMKTYLATDSTNSYELTRV